MEVKHWLHCLGVPGILCVCKVFPPKCERISFLGLCPHCRNGTGATIERKLLSTAFCGKVRDEMGHRYLCCPHMVTVSKAKYTMARPSVISVVTVGLSRHLIAGLPLDLKALIESNCLESNVKMRVPKGTLNFGFTGTLRMITKSRNVPPGMLSSSLQISTQPIDGPLLGTEKFFCEKHKSFYRNKGR